MPDRLLACLWSDMSQVLPARPSSTASSSNDPARTTSRKPPKDLDPQKLTITLGPGQRAPGRQARPTWRRPAGQSGAIDIVTRR